MCCRFKLFQNGGDLINLYAGLEVLQAAREFAGDRKKL
jgi:hypothetical protein